jgi:hypothetical protein
MNTKRNRKHIIISGLVILVSFPSILFVGYRSIIKDKVEEIDHWEIEGYKIVLLKRTGIAGPENFRYDLYSNRFFGLFKNRIGISYSGTLLNDDDSCLVIFKDEDGYDFNNEIYKFDKCKLTIEEINNEP